MKKFIVAFAVAALFAAPAFAKSPSVSAGLVGGVSESGASSGVIGGSAGNGGYSTATVQTTGQNYGAVTAKGSTLTQSNTSTTYSTISTNTYHFGAAAGIGQSSAQGANGGITFGAGLKF